MKTILLNKQSMQRITAAVLTTLPEGSYPPGLATRVAELRTKQMEADDIIAQKEAPLRASIAVRDQAFDAMIDATVLTAGLALGHARANGLLPLVNRLQFRLSNVRRQRFDRRLQLCQQVADAVREELPALATSGLTPAMLDDLDAKIAAATAALVVPRDAIVTRRAATERLPLVLREIDQILLTGVDPLVYGLRNTHPDFYARYRAAREIVDRPASRPANSEQEGAGTATTAGRPVVATHAQPLAA